MIGSTLLAHRWAIKRNGYFNETFGHGEDTEFVVHHLVNDGAINVVPRFLMTYQMPEAGKKYPGSGVFHRFMIDKYRCGIAHRWGEDTAKKFVEVIRGNARATNPVQKKWRKAGPKLTIPAHAPCRDAETVCSLRGSICRKRPDRWQPA